MAFCKGRRAYILPGFWQKMVCHAFALKVETIGTPLTGKQAIFVSNHLSYLDIPVIGSVLPASFVAKAEVASWPVFGFLAKLQQTAFISRSRSAVQREKGNLAAFLEQGKSLVIFPEGTSSDGSKVLPFRSSLFGIALEAASQPPIQPFTIELVEIDGRKVNNSQGRDHYAWHGDMTLMPHFWAFAKSNGAKVRLHFHTPLQVKGLQDRKKLAQTCHQMVAGPLENSIARAA